MVAKLSPADELFDKLQAFFERLSRSLGWVCL
jgi:hypothetical protein